MKSYIVKVNGVTYNVEIEESDIADSKPSFAPARQVLPPPAVLQTPKLPDSGKIPLTSPLPGTVLRILSSSGQIVKKSQPLLIIEAMKMENEIAAPADGVVASINVSLGQAVNPGDVLLTIS